MFTFTTQKHSVRGERIGHARSGSSALCPVLSAVHRVTSLLTQDTTPDTPLHACPTVAGWCNVTGKDISTHLKHATTEIGGPLGLNPP